LADYQKALELDPTCPSAHVNIAVMAVQDGDFPTAESHYRRAIPGRDTAETHNGLGYVLAHQGKTGDATAEFRKAIEIDPHFTPAYNNLAGTLEQQGKLDEAAEYYRRSLAEKPTAAGYKALGAVLRKLGKADEAAALEGRVSARP
jgi:Tfp pilus assembly protein PilF